MFVRAEVSNEDELNTSPVVKVDHPLPTVHAMPVIDISHKACSLPRCMSCAFNVMSDYFNSNQVSKDKTAPRQHVNSKFAKSPKARTASPPRSRMDIHVVQRPKTASPAMTGKMAYRPKLKQPTVKAVYQVKQPIVSGIPKLKQSAAKTVYRVKSPVLAVDDVKTVKNVILPDKGQFFKYAGPNQMWVRKKV
jgi:hypothetical protein